MDSTQAFHGIINLFLIPLWLLSGALFPIAKASGWIRVLMYMNPLTYGVEALRVLLYPGMDCAVPSAIGDGNLAVVFSGNVRTCIPDGKSPHHEACRVIAEQYAYFPALIAGLNGTSAVLLAHWPIHDRAQSNRRTSRLHDRCRSLVGVVSGLLSVFSLPRWRHSVSRAIIFGTSFI